jgi:NADP-dependent 3-hydroxy acid dehydrogenase YdfG
MPSSRLELLKIEEWDRMIDVNLKGVRHCRSASPHDCSEERAYYKCVFGRRP